MRLKEAKKKQLKNVDEYFPLYSKYVYFTFFTTYVS